MNDTKHIKLHGRIILNGKIKALTGLHIGGSPGALAIGGVDLPVIRNPITQEPYIPGSSLKGKMRSLWEKAQGASQEYPVNKTPGKEVYIHACRSKKEYENCKICQIYGSTGDSGAIAPTRIIVRDVPLDIASMQAARTDLPYSEIKWEAAIDRVTSAATPRQIERVPAGAIFDNMQIVFNVFKSEDLNRFLDVLTALGLVEDDYLGGHGSRGSGRVAFTNLELVTKSAESYRMPQTYPDARGDLATFLADAGAIQSWLADKIPVTDGGD
jgi:CRISPR-associated protein Csm3